MATPKDTIETVTHPDGSITTTTTSYHSNGNAKKRTVEKRDAGDNVRDTTETTYARDGDPTREANEKRDADGRLEETTEMKFDSDGNPQRTRRTEYDDQGRPIKETLDKFQGTRKVKGQISESDYHAKPPRRVIVTEDWCEHHRRVKLRTTQVFYNRAGRWHEEKRERRTDNLDCATGERVSLNRTALEGYATVASAAVAVLTALTGWMLANDVYWAVSLAASVIAAALFNRYLERLRQLEIEIGDLAFSLCHEDEVVQPDGAAVSRAAIPAISRAA